jgi:hypothetical protein
VKELCKEIATAMTSPQTSTTEVIATMATTGIHDDSPPNLNLTADMPTVTETHAPAMLEPECHGSEPVDGNKASDDIGKDKGEEEIHQAPAEDVAPPAPSHDGLPRDFENKDEGEQAKEEPIQRESIRPEDAAIPQLNHDILPGGFDLPDPAQIAGLDALIAMGQMGQLGYNPLALAQAAGFDMPMMPIPNQDNQWLDQADYVPDADRPEDRLVGYAKLVFEDGEFYMNTHSVILGRDPTAHRAAQRREKEEAKRKMEAETPGPPKTPVQIKREHMSYSRSVFSEKSGILRDGDDSDQEAREKRRLRKKASKRSKSTGSSHELSRGNSLAQQPPKHHVYEAQYPARIKEENAVPVDPASLRPDPNECPIIPLHPPGNAPASAYKSISREHVKIAYNFEKATFEMHIYGRNGAFVDEVYHPQNSVVELKSGNTLQIGQVPLVFVLPDGIVHEGQAQYDDELATDRRSAGGKEMSFDFEEDKRNGIPEESSPEPLSDDGDDDEDEDGEEDMDEEGEELEADDDEEGQEVSDQEQDQSGLMEEDEEEEVEEEVPENQPQPVAPSGKKRGPGRPPKNGIMSAREERERKLALKAVSGNQKGQKSLKSVPDAASAAPPEKKKVGRPRKHDKPDPTEPEKPKRKYTKRKPKEPKEGDAQDGEAGEDQEAKEKKQKKTKPPRSPSPVFDESTLTPEQLQKPQANYVTLIYEALSNSKEGKLGLPQIYRAIQRKYPYFVLKVGTLGWQSSVRHNLSQHQAFEKVERDGKGWMWGIVKGVSVEKEKKRRTPPPPQMGGPMHHQPIYQAGQPPYMGGYHPHHQMMGHPGYMPQHMMHGPPHPGQPQHYMVPPPPHMNGQPPPPPPNSHPPPKPITGLAAAMIPQLAASSRRGYSSPYAPTGPAPPPVEPPRTEQPKPTEQQQPSTQAAPSPVPTQGSQPQMQPPGNQSSVGQQVQAPSPAGPLVQTQAPAAQPAFNQAPQSHSPLSPERQPQQAPPPPPAPAPQQPAPPPTSNSIPELPQHDQAVIGATESFKASMLRQFKDPKGEEILNSAVNRVLGYTHETSVPGNKYEEDIIKALRTMLKHVAEWVDPCDPNRASTPQTNGQQQPQPTTNQSETQASATLTPQPSKTSGADKPTPTVMRPTFTGQGQSRPNVQRPPMGTPGMKRANSGSPAQIGSESGHIAGQKRALEESDDYKDVKRLNGAGMSPLKT